MTVLITCFREKSLFPFQKTHRDPGINIYHLSMTHCLVYNLSKTKLFVPICLRSTHQVYGVHHPCLFLLMA